MALQKKKRNFILKYVWKKIQLKKLKKFNFILFFKKFKNYILLKKNIKTLSFKTFINIYNIFFYYKYNLNFFFKRLDIYNIYYNESKIIRFNVHYNNSNSLINFLINFHDNIVRDFKNILNKNLLFYNKSICLLKKKDLSIILLKIKKLLKYFFIFTDYFSINLFNYYLIFYNYFKFFYNNHSLFYLNFINFFKIFESFCIKKKIFNFKYILFYKKMNNNVLINYLIKKKFGYYYFKKYYSKHKSSYFTKLKGLNFFYKKNLINMNYFKKLNFFRFFSNNYNNIYYYRNYLNFNLNLFQRNFLYLNYFINKLIISKFFNKKKKSSIFSFTTYLNKFNYFDNTFYSNYYNNYHNNNWHYDILNYFNFNFFSKDNLKIIKYEFPIFQNYYFSKQIWSNHVIFTKNISKLNYMGLKFFNNKNIKNKFLYFFFKVNKLRYILNYLIFFLLPINLNLIWIEYNSIKKDKLKSVALDYLKFEIKKNDWFVKQNSFVNKTKNYLKSFFIKKYRNFFYSKTNIKNFFLIKSKFKFLFKFEKNKIFNINKNFLIYKKYIKKIMYIRYKKKNYINRLSLFNIPYNSYFIKKLNYIFNKINKKKLLFNYKFLTKLLDSLRFKNFWIKRVFSYNKLKLRPVFIKKFVYSFKYRTLFSFLSKFSSIQYFLYKKISKKHIYMQNLLLYYNIKKESIFSSAIFIYFKELDYKKINFYYIKNSYFFNTKVQKKLLFKKNYNYIIALKLWYIYYLTYLNIYNYNIFFYKYCINFYTLKLLFEFYYSFGLNYNII